MEKKKDPILGNRTAIFLYDRNVDFRVQVS